MPDWCLGRGDVTLAFREAGSTHSVDAYDSDVVLRFSAGGTAVFTASDGCPVGMQTAIMALGSPVTIQPMAGVLVLGAAELVVQPLNTGVLVKIADGKWLVSLRPRVVPAAPPSPPVLLTAVGAFNSVDLTWSAPSSSGGAAVTQYAAESSIAGVEWLTSGVCEGSVLSLSVDDNLVPGTEYQFRVRAANAAGFSEPSNILSATPVPAPPVPSPLPPSPVAGTYDTGTAISGYPPVQTTCYDWASGKILLACGSTGPNRGVYRMDPMDFAAPPVLIEGSSTIGQGNSGYPFALASSREGAITFSTGDGQVCHRPAGSTTWSRLPKPASIPSGFLITSLAYDESDRLWCSLTVLSTGESAFGTLDPVTGTVVKVSASYAGTGLTSGSRYPYSMVSNYDRSLFTAFVEPAGTGVGVVRFNTATEAIDVPFGAVVSDWGGVAAYLDLMTACRFSTSEMTVFTSATGSPSRVTGIPAQSAARGGVMNLNHPTKGRCAFFVRFDVNMFTPLRVYY
jgi:hypothetical protein